MVSSSEDFGTPTDCSPGLTRLATGGASGSASPTRTPSRAVAESDRGERPRDRPCRAPIVPSRGSSNNAVRKCRVREFDFASRIHESCRTPRRLAAGRAERLLHSNRATRLTASRKTPVSRRTFDLAGNSLKGAWFSVPASRSYKQAEEWKQSDNSGKDDILTLCKLLDQAHSWILNQQQQERAKQAA